MRAERRTERGIVLAGGSGTRLHPLTRGISKQLVPVYDKPLVYFPLTTLMLAGIRQILVITAPHDHEAFCNLLGDGSQWGVRIEYAVQRRPEGLAQAFLVGARFVGSDRSALVLGDNIFFGHGVSDLFQKSARRTEGATIFGYWVRDPRSYGVAEFDDSGQVVGLEEKPLSPKSHYAVAGLYFYDGEVVELARSLKPSARGELEITDLNRLYLERRSLYFEKLGRGVAWLDTGTPEALLQAANFIQAVQSRQGLQVACPEEVAFHMGWIDAEQVLRLARPLCKTTYGEYLVRLVDPK